MYLTIMKIQFPTGAEELMPFLTFSKNFNLYTAIYGAIEEHSKEAGTNLDGMDYIDYILAIKDVPEGICAKHGFRLFNGYSYSFIRAQEQS